MKPLPTALVFTILFSAVNMCHSVGLDGVNRRLAGTWEFVRTGKDYVELPIHSGPGELFLWPGDLKKTRITFENNRVTTYCGGAGISQNYTITSSEDSGRMTMGLAQDGLPNGFVHFRFVKDTLEVTETEGALFFRKAERDD